MTAPNTATIERSPEGFFSRFKEGVLLLADGFRFLRRERSLWALAWVPVLFATLSVLLATSLFWSQISEIHLAWSGLFPSLEASAWWTWLWVGPGIVLFWLAGWLAVVVSFAIALIAALLLANLASAPFLDQLSQRVEAIVLGSQTDPKPRRSTSIPVEILRSFGAELQRVGFLAGIWLGLSLLGFVLPGAHLVTGPLLVATTVLFLPLDYAGFALDRRELSFASRRHWLREHSPTMVGFGGVAFAACLVPGLNLLIMPSLVTAGTLLVMRKEPVDVSVPAIRDPEPG
jgi:CysZ protein